MFAATILICAVAWLAVAIDREYGSDVAESCLVFSPHCVSVMAFRLSPWRRRAVRTPKRTAFDSLGLAMPPALKLESPPQSLAPQSLAPQSLAPVAQLTDAQSLAPVAQLTGAQRAKRLLRLRISALSGLREDDNLDLPPVAPGTWSES